MVIAPSKAVALSGRHRGVIDVRHDLMHLGVHFLGGPVQPLGVLGHLQGGHGHAAGVDGLEGAITMCFCSFRNSRASLVVGMLATSM